jgi:ABC-2 type transport system permease protein
MRADVLRLSLRQQRFGILGWIATWGLLIGVYVASWPAVRSNGKKYDDILADLPPAMKSLIGSAAQGSGAFGTPEGYFSAELLALTGPLLVVAMGLLHGTRAVAHDEESGVLELLLAQPVTRVRVLLERFGAELVLVVGVLAAGAVALLSLGPIVDFGLSVGQVLRAFFLLCLLSTEALALGLLLGAVTGRVGRSRASGGAVLLVAFLLHALGPSVSWLGWGEDVSPFATVVRADPFNQGIGLGTLLTLLLPTLVMVVAATRAFVRRDLLLA